MRPGNRYAQQAEARRTLGHLIASKTALVAICQWCKHRRLLFPAVLASHLGDDFKVVDRVTEIAQKRGVPNAQVALAWLLSRPAVTAPIVGATKPGHLADALAALSIRLDADEIKALEEPYRPHPVLGHG